MRTYPALAVRPLNPSPEFLELLAATLDDYGLLALEDDAAGATVRAFFTDGTERTAAAAAVETAFPGIEVDSLEVPDEDWAERSQAALRAIRAGALTITPPWDIPGGDRSTVIVIVPSTGFGTGHHATTRLCLEALQEQALRDRDVMDVGTGSGVLAIAAVKLGATRVVAIDSDQDATDNAAENARLNGTALDLRTASIESVDLPDASFDVITANLTGAALVSFGAALELLTKENGTLVLSGLREDEESEVVRAFRQCHVTSRRTEDGWVCLGMRRRTQA